ncbi:MAG: hypothetical protein HFH68_04495 [Lachnospiraceae bacterium]|nr:hypothetical protein [Lachnospiraceae bacterium]
MAGLIYSWVNGILQLIVNGFVSVLCKGQGGGYLKKTAHIMPFLLFLVYLAIPVVSLINLLAGYSVWIYSYHAYALITAAISLVAVVNSLLVKDTIMPEAETLCILFMPLLPLINWICYIIPAGWKFSALCMSFCLACTLVYMLKYIKHVKRKIIISVTCIIFFIPICFFSLLDCIFGDFGTDTVVQVEYPPDRRCKAEVVDNDQGALGGGVFVNICNTEPAIDLYFIKVFKKPHCIYSGRWGEYEGMELYWKDNHILSLNGSEYFIE